MSEETTQETQQETPEASGATYEIPSEYIQDGKILGQYDSPQALLDAVAGQGRETPAPVEAPTAPATELRLPESTAAETPQVTQEALMGLYAEARMNGGTLPDERYTELQAQGYERAVIDNIFDGYEAKRQLAASQIASQVGGQEKIQKAIDWASKNLTDKQQADINRDLEMASVDGQAAIWQGLIQRSGAGTGSVAGAAGNASDSVPFKSEAEISAAFADPKYSDPVQGPAYREQLERRMKATMMR